MPKKNELSTLASVPWADNPYNTVEQFMQGLKSGIRDDYRMPQIRASGMPFCPLLFSLNDGWGEVEFRSQYYFSTGTAIHELIQKFAHRNSFGVGILWGDWKCSACHEIKHKACLKPKKACSCGKDLAEWEYEEVTIEFNGISGHIDTILMVGPNQYVIVDYKTTGVPFGGTRLNTTKYPFRGNVLQISLYCYVMKEKYGLNIVGFSLVYVDRARPLERSADYHHVHQEWNDLMHKRMGVKLKWITDNIPLAKRVWARLHVKGKMPKEADIAELISIRPCTTMSKWEGWMAALFERNLPSDGKLCEHLDYCCGSDKKATKHFTRLYKEFLES